MKHGDVTIEPVAVDAVQAESAEIKLGDWVQTRRHGGGYVRGLSHTTPELCCVDVELFDAGERIGWVAVPLSDIEDIRPA